MFLFALRLPELCVRDGFRVAKVGRAIRKLRIDAFSQGFHIEKGYTCYNLGKSEALRVSVGFAAAEVCIVFEFFALEAVRQIGDPPIPASDLLCFGLLATN